MNPADRIPRLGAAIASLIVLAAACAPEPAPRSIQAGQTRVEVVEALGEPDGIGEFTVSDEPVFGPQEGLMSLVPSGTRVEEWRYVSEGAVRYIWFAGEPGSPREEWRVIDSAVYPADAVY